MPTNQGDQSEKQLLCDYLVKETNYPPFARRVDIKSKRSIATHHCTQITHLRFISLRQIFIVLLPAPIYNRDCVIISYFLLGLKTVTLPDGEQITPLLAICFSPVCFYFCLRYKYFPQNFIH
jgi:hypothetical protein